MPGIIKVLYFPNEVQSNWVESIAVAEKAIKNWLSVLKVIKYSEVLAPNKRPKNKYYETIVSFITGQFMAIKLIFLKLLLTVFKHS